MSKTTRSVLVALWAATAIAAFAVGRTMAPMPSSPRSGDAAASIGAALAEADALERLERTRSVLLGLDPSDFPGVVAVYEQMIPLLEAWELVLPFSAWARSEPNAALEYALAWPLRDMRQQRRIAVRAIFTRWGQADPERALAAAEEVAASHPRLRSDVWSGLVAGWASAEPGPSGLAAFLAELRPMQQRDESAGAALRALVRARGPDAALRWADTILLDEGLDPNFKRSVFEPAVARAASLDPALAGAWVTAHAEEAYAVQGPLIVADQWGRVDGAAAMTWLGGLAAGDQRDQAVRNAFQAWSGVDRPGAKAWLDSLTPTTFHDPALEAWARQLVEEVPVEAIGSCERIVEPARRQRCTESLAKSWYAKDAVAAEAWLQQSELDEEARERVRTPARQPTSSSRRQRRPR